MTIIIKFKEEAINKKRKKSMNFRDVFERLLDSDDQELFFSSLYLSDDRYFVEGCGHKVSKSHISSIAKDYFRLHKQEVGDKKKTEVIFFHRTQFTLPQFVAYIESSALCVEEIKEPYMPKKYEKNGKTYLNSWTPPLIVQAVKDRTAVKSENYNTNISNFWKFTNSVCGLDDYATNYLLQWSKEMIYENKKHTKLIILANSVQGTGKSTFGKILGQILEGSFSTVSTSQIEGRFNSFLDGSILCLVNEWSPRASDQEHIKALTDSFVSIERKGKDVQTKTSVTNFIFTTNRDDIFSRGDDDRRSVIIVGEQDDGYKYKIGFLAEKYPELISWMKANSKTSEQFKEDFLTDIAIYLNETVFLKEGIDGSPKPTVNHEVLKMNGTFEVVGILEQFCKEELQVGVDYHIPEIAEKWRRYSIARTTEVKSLDFMFKKKQHYTSDVYKFIYKDGYRYLRTVGLFDIDGPKIVDGEKF